MTTDLAELGLEAGKKPGTSARIAPVRTPLSIELEYYKIARKVVREIVKYVDDKIVPQYTKQMTTDAIDQDKFSPIRKALPGFVFRALNGISKIVNKEGDRHTKKFGEAVKRSIGIDIGAVIKREGIEDVVALTMNYSTSLITNLATETLNRLESTIYSAVMQGKTTKELSAEIKKVAAISDRRAKLIATDQMQKFNGNLNKARQEELGITSYEWITVGDSRVRHDHAERSGKIFKWNSPPSDGHPGQAVRCRCAAGGIVEF